jgi:hypothetical protein
VAAPRLALLALALLLASAAPASAHHGTPKKAIWGPATPADFRTYHALGVGIYETSVNWAALAPTRPANPMDPSDPAYRWPAEVDTAIRLADRHGIRVMLMLTGAPAWANGGRTSEWAPKRVSDLAGFATAAARRYPSVRHWMIWGEPTRPPNFMPLRIDPPGGPLSWAERWAPRKYARMLDACYAALKAVRRSNVVIGGNTFTAGHVLPLYWIRHMRMPDASRPRMDLYGHNPFSLRRPDLRQPPVAMGYADFSDLDTLSRWLERYGYRDSRGRRMRIFLAEFTVPTDHPSLDFNFWTTRSVAASWLRDALRIVRRKDWLYTLGWHTLYDDAPAADGLETNRGLLQHDGRRKPAFKVFRNG